MSCRLQTLFLLAYSLIRILQDCFYLRKYIEEKISADETLSWVEFHIGNGFAGTRLHRIDYIHLFFPVDKVYTSVS
ncbi:hypothetical protein JRO89_XS02G0289000 [Xanthoceras sorbifolium]|uniref:Uncharacterized protein n=1 Tax=Xanthoceras sorbifolium TaxID=99658 RepID=A0ABQ8IHA9_9ROSI|nr:hypothetical protein JRO89_XS02G0289000 [Xanthoceras sorbifolium]